MPVLVWEAEQIEHVAVWAAETGDTALESWCDSALAGLEDELTLLTWAGDQRELALHMERGKNLGLRSRKEAT